MLLLSLHLGFLLPAGLLDLRCLHLFLVVLLVRHFLRLCVGLHLREIGRDLLQDCDDSLRLLLRIRDARVRGLPGGRLVAQLHRLRVAGLQEEGLVDGATLLVELLQDDDGLGNGVLRLLGILDGRLVLLLAGVPDLRGFIHEGGELGDGVIGLLDCRRQELDAGLGLVELEIELDDLLLLVDLRGVRLRHLVVAPILVVVLVLLLLHQSEDHLLDHVIDIVERALHLRSKLFSEAPEGLGLEPPGLLAQQVDRLCLGVRALQQRRETQPARPGDQRCLRRRRQGGIRRRLGADASDLRKDADASVDGLHLLLPKR
mmetsp:Transcript_76222/g.210838  ORF Transcript_76222/g.210838 Transcript_76222/m.210838 type:complete len:316 (+) Transcript_76222:434-1381(+)